MQFLKNNFSTLIIVSLSLGLAWAIRGSFGHEWGASWAGAIGSFMLIIAIGKKEWLKNAPSLAALGAIGWAVGGMSSYGIVIGYCRSTDFINVLYGFSMLFVIGGIYGYIGGGLLGLGLESGSDRRTKWASLIAQMVAGGMLSWGFLIYQMEWFMTPPRSELWAAAFGGCGALGWFLWREGYHKAFRTAIFTAVGAGLGFSIGNFIQVLGSVSSISYNWWNVMEFVLGFTGGLFMTYAVITSEWPEKLAFTKNTNNLALVFLFLIIPYVNFDQAFTIEKFTKLLEFGSTSETADFASNQLIYAFSVIVIFSSISIFIWRRFLQKSSERSRIFIEFLSFSLFLYYLIFLVLRNGLLHSPLDLGNSNTLYLPVFVLIFAIYILKRDKSDEYGIEVKIKSFENWKIVTLVIFLLFIAFALISINIHDGLPGSQLRFK